MSQRNLLLSLIVMAVCYACYVRAEQNPYARYLASGFATIDGWALHRPPAQDLFNAAMNGMVGELVEQGDEHSQFVDANEEAAFREDYDQLIGGVGLRMEVLGDPPLPTVIGRPEEGSPARKADIRLADRIEAVDGKSIAGLSIEKVMKLVRGPVGEPVTLSLRRRGVDQPLVVNVERGEIAVESVLGDRRDADERWVFVIREKPRIGYVRIIKFGDKTASELQRVLANLKRSGVEGLILDVRGDAGGVLDGAVEISELFLRAGLDIVTTRDRDGATRDRFVSSGAGEHVDLPLAVLVDGQSASASEILAACVQDYGRAKIVGERTYGKGTVQSILRVESGRSILKLTIATYWRPSGKNIHRMPGDDLDAEWGVSPDPGFAVPLNPEQYKVWEEYRRRRDLVREGMEPELAAELSKGDVAVPDDYVDRALERAVEYLETTLRGEAAETSQAAPGA